MTRYDAYCIADFKYKWFCERHSASQTFHFGNVGISIHKIAIIRLKTNIPDEVLTEARKNLLGINKWVRNLFEVY